MTTSFCFPLFIHSSHREETRPSPSPSPSSPLSHSQTTNKSNKSTPFKKESRTRIKNPTTICFKGAAKNNYNMDPIRPPSPSDVGDHFVDIHEVVLHEEPPEAGPSTSDATTSISGTNNRLIDRRVSRSIRSRGLRPPRGQQQQEQYQQRGFNRQVSLATGFSVINGESRARRGRRVLARGGISFGGFASVDPQVVGEGQNKGDFRLFRTKTKPPINKQSSLMPIRNNDRDQTESSDAVDSTNNNNSPAMQDNGVLKAVPAVRYYAALRGPELDEVKECEDILLPKDETWPFLLRFPINSFGICLGLSSQAILWQALATSPATKFLHINHDINLALWFLALFVHLAISTIYLLKCLYYFEAVRREYYHPVRINFFFAPWVVCMFLAIGTPRAIAPQGDLHPSIWCIFMAPYFFLELKIYGQWLSGGKRRLCKVANPSSHLSVVGNFVGAILADRVGWNEAGKFFWAVGFAHYLVVFVTLYQRLPTSEALPKELHPVYSMFIAAPSAASISWAVIYDEFDGLARTCYFIALFLYISLVVRINFFTGFRFSVAWWAYTFPMTTVSVATIKYVEEVPCVLSKGLVLVLSAVSTTMVAVLFVSTFLHAFVWRTLFPNDLAIAITKKKQCLSGKKSASKRYYDPAPWPKLSPFPSSPSPA